MGLGFRVSESWILGVAAALGIVIAVYGVPGSGFVQVAHGVLLDLVMTCPDFRLQGFGL